MDGLPRSKAEEDRINKIFAGLFNTPAGAEVLKHLRSVTIEMVGGVDINPNSLMHIEGQRYIVGLIERRSAKGAKK